MINLTVFNDLIHERAHQINKKDDMVYNHILKLAEESFAKIDKIRFKHVNEGTVEQYQVELRKKFKKSLGNFIENKCPLNAQTTGIIELDNYYIEKVIYESLPKFYVTANLYIPKNLKAKAPAILINLGHWDDGKADHDHQKLAGNLAAMGFVVLIYDPIGQGERIQLLNKKTGKSLTKYSVYEHETLGLRSLTKNVNIANFFINDAIRSIDYLVSREEVDVNRIGTIGASGGGMLTIYLMVLEDRIAAAVPTCYICGKRAFLHAKQVADAEQQLDSTIKDGFEQAENCIAFAPRPLLINTAMFDEFPIKGSINVFEDVKPFYEILGAAENLEFATEYTGHGMYAAQRIAAYKFFQKHLGNPEEAPDYEMDVKLLKVSELSVAPLGQVMEIPGSRNVLDILKGMKFSEHKVVTYKDIKKLLRLPKMGKPKVKTIDTAIEQDEIEHIKLVVESEHGIEIPVNILRKNKNGKTTLILNSNGKPSILLGSYYDRVLNGETLVFCDYRGIGETKYGVCYCVGNNTDDWLDRYYFHTYMMLDRVLIGCRVFDILQVIESIPEDDNGIHIEAEGEAALVALFAGLLSKRVSEVTLIDMLSSYESLLKADTTSWDASVTIPGILNVTDIPELVEMLSKKVKLTIKPGE
ncbi:MAG TPA: hypothetical protein GXX14_06870 [Clostridiaceae bacterium]|nr:hypothetical protein [Clostridiaceae bacterium]